MSDNYVVVFFIMSIMIFLISILITANDNLKNKVTYLKVIRNMAIILPVVLCIIIFFYFFFLPSYNLNATQLEFKIVNLGLSIFAILAAVWIGLNIYNVVDKKEVVELKKSIKQDVEVMKESLKQDVEVMKKEVECFSKIESSRTIAQSMTNNYEKISIYNEIINKYGNHYSSYVYRAMYYQSILKYLDAIIDFNVALTLSNNNFDVIYNRGKCYYMIGKYKQAIDDFSTCIKNNVYKVGAHNNRALSYKMLKRYDEAIKDLTLLINEEEENSYYFHYARGGCYFDLENFEDAIKDYKDAFELCTEFDEPYFNILVLAYLNNGDFEQAVKLIESNIDKIHNKDKFLKIKKKALDYIEEEVSSLKSSKEKEKTDKKTDGKMDEVD